MGWQVPLDLLSVSFCGISQRLTITVTQQRSPGLPLSVSLKKLHNPLCSSLGSTQVCQPCLVSHPAQ